MWVLIGIFILFLVFMCWGMGSAMEEDISASRIMYKKSVAKIKVEDIWLARYSAGEIVTTYPKTAEDDKCLVYVEFEDGKRGYMDINNLEWLKYAED